LFIAIAYIAFSSARKAEQNMVWIGMAKETAHQLGTPISSLVALVELLKDEQVSANIIEELDKDAQRLEKITERFSKVGSQPELYPENLYQILNQTIGYLKTRVSSKIVFTTNFNEQNELYLPLSSSLFSWVIENLVRNSVDAIGNRPGTIEFEVQETSNEVIIDLKDNGKGIPKSKYRTIFNPGFTTKKRGWGLGLSLSKRIIQNYHKGKIFLKGSEPFKQTVFRIVLKNKKKGIKQIIDMAFHLTKANQKTLHLINLFSVIVTGICVVFAAMLFRAKAFMPDIERARFLILLAGVVLVSVLFLFSLLSMFYFYFMLKKKNKGPAQKQND
jgi:K+-sensing histidine kinase KdpD